MAAPQARSWANLPADLLQEIFHRVPCAADRHRAYYACTAWLEARVDCPPALPWLLLPAPDRDGASATRTVCVLSDCRVHHHHLPFTRLGARYFGSHDGAWLFVHYREGDSHELLNVRSGDVRRHIPSEVQVATVNGSFSPNVAIQAAALSTTSPDDANCVAVFIGIMATATLTPHRPYRPYAAMWRMGWHSAYEIRPPGVGLGFCFVVEDLTFHNGAFHLLGTNRNDVEVYIPEFDMGDSWLDRGKSWRFHVHLGPLNDECVRARYLVSSRGELLMVVRFTTNGDNLQTTKFKVFRATKRPQNPEGDANADSDFPVAAYPWAWSELDTLDGRILFVGHGCSRSYELHDEQGRIQYMGFKAGIYFFDHRVLYFVDGSVQYPCSDNGRWSESNGRVQRCFPPADPSCNSPPAWLLP